MKQLLTLIRREFWEHRGLWIAPLVVAAVLIVMTLLSGANTGGIKIHIDEIDFKMPDGMTLEQKSKLFGVFISVLGVPVLITMIIVVFFYLADCLYAERKDRSILFWRSMPVSDAATVWSKVVTALAVVPFYVWLVGMVTVTLGFLIVAWRVEGSPVGQIVNWDTGIWLKVQGIALLNMLVASLWYAPVAGYMLAISAWARRSVLMWIILPPIFLTWMEEILLDTGRIANFIGYRLGGFFQYLGDDSAQGPKAAAASGANSAQRLAEKFDTISAADLLAQVDLWAGVAVAVGLIYVAIRVRRFRDDT